MYAPSSVVGSLGAQHLPLLLSQVQPDRQRMQSPTLECTPKGYSGRVASTLPKSARMQARVSGKSQEAKGPREMQGRAGCRSLGSLAERERGGVAEAAIPDSRRSSGDSLAGPNEWRWEDLGGKLVAVAAAVVLPFAPFSPPHSVPGTAWELTGASSTPPDHPGHPSFSLAPAALANGLLQMPPLKLNNDYYLVRAGESEWEAMGILHTNPVDKTNVTSGLSEAGKRQAVAAGREIERSGACNVNCWLWPSISQRSYQTAEVIAYLNSLSYSRIVPEYSFLDARGLGAYENAPLSSLEEIHRADSESERVRPPPTTDGTPNESAHDVFVRVRQMMSVIETQYSGDAVIVVSPDSDNLSILQAALMGLDLRSHDTLQFSPGEVRHVVLPENVEREAPISGLVKI